MKKGRNKLLLTVLLALTMVLTTTPFTAVAQSGPVSVQAEDGALTSYNTLYEAVKAAKDGETVLLNDDVEMGYFELNGVRTSPTMVVEDKNIILDGQGHTVTAKNEAFSMIEVEASGTITVKNIVLDGSNAPNRIYSNIINIEGGKAYIEDKAVLTNNATNAVGIGTNVPGGLCVMNGGEITGGNVTTGGTDTGAAVTVLEESAFIMNGGKIYGNNSTTGASGIMANRGGKVVINDGLIEGNTTSKSSMGSAIHIKGGEVTINGGTIRNNETTSAGYGSIYVTNHSSFSNKWDGILNIKGGTIESSSPSIYLWSRGDIKDTAAYIRFSDSPTIGSYIYVIANGFSNLDFKPLEVVGEFAPTNPVQVKSGYDYVVGQTMMQYADDLTADNEQFIAPTNSYGYQKDAENNLLYTEQKRQVNFWDGEQNLTELSYWEFVEDFVDEPAADAVSKDGYALTGWYTDKELSQEWDFAADKLARSEDTFDLYAKWEVIPAEAPVLPEKIEVTAGCGEDEYVLAAPEFDKLSGYTYSYEWQDEDGKPAGSGETLAIALENGGAANYTLTVTATRDDNGQTASAGTVYTVNRAEHQFGDYVYDSKTHQRECAGCEAVIDQGAHEFTWIIDRQASKTESGLKHEECTVCGYAKDPVEIPVVAAEQKPDGPAKTGDGEMQTANAALAVMGLSALAMIALACKRRKI